jgi:hypothetical protein
MGFVSSLRDHPTRLVLFVIILATLPCYVLGVCMLLIAPKQDSQESPSQGQTTPTLDFTVQTSPSATFGIPPSMTPRGNPLVPTPGQVYIQPTAVVLPTVYVYPTIMPYMSPTPAPSLTPIIIIPTNTAQPSATPTITLAPSATATIQPSATPTNTEAPTTEPIVEPSPTQETGL